jgi:hypothetical protein
MKTVMDTNITRAETYRRYAIGVLILGAFLMNPGLPVWVALVALYPIATAINQWDPLNAAFESIIRAINLYRIKRAVEMLKTRSMQTVKVRA